MKPDNALAVTKANKSSLSITVHANRSTEYDWEPVTSDWPRWLRLTPCGDSVPIDDIDVTLALKELFEVYTYQRDWLRRELWVALSRGELSPVQQKWARLVLGIKRSMTATTPDNDTKYAAWLNRYSAKDKRLRARKKFADRWADFAKDFGPLSDELDSKTFGRRAADLSLLIMEVSGLRAEVDGPEQQRLDDAKVARIHAATARVTGSRWKNEKASPDLFSALAYAIEHSRDFGVRYRICENSRCERLFVLATTQKKWCSGACKVDAHRQ